MLSSDLTFSSNPAAKPAMLAIDSDVDTNPVEGVERKDD